MTQAPTAPAAPAASNTVKIEDAGPARKRLTITIPAELVDTKIRDSMSTLSTETALPGFRKGHVPQKLLEKRFGTSVRTETKNQLVAAAYAEVIEQHQLKPVGEPEPEESLKDKELQPGKPFTFALDVEVSPTFELPSFDGIEIKKPMLEITKDMIEAELKRLSVAHGTPEKIESDFKEGDRISGYATVTKNDEKEPFFRTDNVGVLMPGKDEGGRGQVLGLMIDGLHGLLKDTKVGDTIEIETTGPELHEREDLRGAKLRMTYEIRAAERITPAKPEQIATQFGLPSEDILREQIKMALEYRRDDEQATAMRDQVIEHLSDEVDFELPERLSAQQATRQLEQYRLELLYRGLSVEEVEEKLAQAREESEESAREGLKRFFLMTKLAEHFKVEVSEQEVNGRIAAIAAQRNVRPEKLRAELAQAGRLGEVARLIRDQKAADRVVQQAKKVEISADDWNKIYQDKTKAKKSGGGGAKKEAKPKPAAKSSSKAKADDDAPAKKTSKKK
jgi:trigger factor